MDEKEEVLKQIKYASENMTNVYFISPDKEIRVRARGLRDALEDFLNEIKYPEPKKEEKKEKGADEPKTE